MNSPNGQSNTLLWVGLAVAVGIVAAFAANYWLDCYDFLGIVKGCTAVKKPF